MSFVLVIKRQPPIFAKILSSSSLCPKISSNTRLKQKLSKKNRLHSRLNVRKLARSKSKQVKQRKNLGTKLNIHSPIHTTFKRNIRRYGKRRSSGRKIKFVRCTSKTLGMIHKTCFSTTSIPLNIRSNNMNI
jgi:hypothetical protein